ncbi:hypothetical protein [Spirosoma areae]
MKNSVSYVPLPTKTKISKGELIIRNEENNVETKIMVRRFDPGKLGFASYCCNNSLANCVPQEPGQNCIDVGRVLVWKLK